MFRSIVTRMAFAALCLCGLPRAQADDQPEPPPVKHRVTGLFAPERQNDLRDLVKNSLPGVKLLSIDYETAEATFAYDADKLFNRARPEQIPERFDNLLRSVSSSTFGIRPLCAVPKEKLQLIEIPVVGLDCKACCLAAYESIYKIDGVERATASFKDGLVTALVDPAKTNRPALEEALKKKKRHAQIAVKIVRLNAGDGERLRAIRLRALAESPDAFATTLEEAAAQPPEAWQRQLEVLATFVAILDGADVGLARGARHDDWRDTGYLISMWVAREARRKGLGAQLVEAVIVWARAEGLKRLILDVAEANAPAIGLYTQMGFVPNGAWGRLPPPREAIREIQMEMRL